MNSNAHPREATRSCWLARVRMFGAGAAGGGQHIHLARKFKLELEHIYLSCIVGSRHSTDKRNDTYSLFQTYVHPPKYQPISVIHPIHCRSGRGRSRFFSLLLTLAVFSFLLFPG